jgi:predicted dehydrogenase
MTKKQVGFGVIGLGVISGGHIQGLRDAAGHARIVAVCDKNQDLAERIAFEVGAKAYTDYSELIADPEVAAVDVPLPHNLHYEVAEKALRAGKHVLLEKPMAPTSRECAQLIAIARQGNLLFSVAENTPFVPAYIAVRKLLQSGAIGQVRLVRTLISGSEIERLNDVSSWKGRRAGTIGGAIFDAGPHSFYLLKWLFGDIASVQGIVNKVVDASEVEDNAIVAGRMASGAIFTTEYTFTAEIPWGERLEVYGSTGSVIVDQLIDPPVVHYKHKEDVIGSPIGADTDGPERVEFDPVWWKFKSVAKGVAGFAQAISEGTPAPVDPMDGMYTIQIVESAYSSVEQGGRAVTVSPPSISAR